MFVLGFFGERKKTIWIKNKGFYGAMQKMRLRLQFHRQNKIQDYILFTNTGCMFFKFFRFLN